MTDLGSTYELDVPVQRARRVTNERGAEPTPCLRGGWRTYQYLGLHSFAAGQVGLVVYWGRETGAPHDFTVTRPIRLEDELALLGLGLVNYRTASPQVAPPEDPFP